MSVRILWRSAVFVITLLLIYLAFPILIVPSSLPAIQAILIEGVAPQPSLTPEPDYFGLGQPTVPIQQLVIPESLTLTERLKELEKLHRQGLELMLNR